MRAATIRAGLLALAVAGVGGLSIPTQAADITIWPHRAIYDMELASVRSTSSVSTAGGEMLFEWRDGCDSWTSEQRLRLRLAYNEGPAVDLRSALTSLEAKDGSTFRFLTRRLRNGTEERFTGNAVRRDGQLWVTFTQPAQAEQALDNAILFPNQHTIQLLAAAVNGETVNVRQFFDGTDETGLNDVSVFIGAAQPSRSDNPLLAGRRWNMRMAFYPVAGDTTAAAGEPVPDYEMTILLSEHGVAESLEIDYGDFVIRGALRTIEKLDASGCQP